MKIRVSEIGEVDEATDLWSLFQADAHGRTALFAGQLLRELNEKAPAWQPRLFELVRRGLASTDPAERIAAMHGALQLPSTELAPELEQISLVHGAWLAQAQSPAGRSVLSLFFELLEREPQGSVQALHAFDNAAALVPNPPIERARALVRLDPQRAIQEILASLDGGQSEELIKQLSFSSRFEDLTREITRRPAELRKTFVAIAYRALGAEQFAAAYDRWLSLAASVNSPPEQPPARPVESEASLRFADMLKKMAEAETVAAAPTPLLGSVVLSAEVWADGLRMPEGPPARLFELLTQRSVKMLTSEALIQAIGLRLAQLGWPAPLVAEGEARVRQLGTLGVGNEVDLARDAGLDTVFAIGPRTGAVENGVTFRPVHELLSKLEA